jgi:competence protein ComEC
MPRVRAHPVSWIWDDVQADRDRRILWLTVAFGTGISLYFALPAEPASVLGWALGATGILLGAAALGSDNAALRAVLSCCAALLIGFAVAKHRADSVSAPILVHKAGPSVIEGVVESTELHGKGVRVVIFPERVKHLPASLTPRRARISIRSGGEALRPGDRVRVRAVLMPPPTPAAPNDYDFGRAAYFRQIGAVGFAYGHPQILRSQHSLGFLDSMSIAIESLRARLSKRIHAVLPGSTGAIASALITGDRGGISEEDEFALRDAGLAHVLAIAGLHMALVGLGLFWAARAILALFPAIALTRPIKKWAAVAALASAHFGAAAGSHH